MNTNETPTNVVVTETVFPAKAYIPWRAAGTLAMQALERKIRRRFARVVTEVVDEPIYGYNFDLPHARHRVEQGYEYPENAHLEPVFGRSKTARGTSQMDGSHFRELCVQRKQGERMTNHALHLKSKLQLMPKTWMRAEYVSEQTGIPYDLAFQVVAAFKALSINSWPVARQLLLGVVGTGKIWTPYGTLETGLKGQVLRTGIARANDPAKAALRLVDLASELNEPMYDLDEPETEITELSQMYVDSMTYIEPALIEIEQRICGGYFETDADDMADDDTPDPLYEPPVDDFLDPPGTDNAFSTHPLADGTDALPYAFEHAIRSMDAAELKRLVAGMFTRRAEGGSDPEFEFADEQRAYLRQIVGITDSQIDLVEQYIRDPKGLPPGARIPREVIRSKAIRIPKRFWFFSTAQTRHFWAIYRLRKAEIAAESRQDPNFGRLIRFVETADKRSAGAAIYAYSGRREFELYGIEIVLDGQQQPSKETVAEAWDIYKRRFA